MTMPHFLDPYLRPMQLLAFDTERKDAMLERILKEVHGPKTIAPPKKPVEPRYENIDYVPYHPHTWDSEWQGDYHQGRVCSVCGEISECEQCEQRRAHGGKSPVEPDFDCWRNLARERNRKREQHYQKALERYQAQYDFWKSIPGVTEGDS